MTGGCPDHIGKSYTGGYKIEDEIIRPQGGGKLIYLQKIRFDDDGRLEYRFTYYISARKGKTPAHWVFGRYSLFLPPDDLNWLLAEAGRREWSGFLPSA